MKTMNKLIFSVLAFLCLSFSLSAVAAPSLSDVQISDQAQSTQKKGLRSPACHQTDIYVFNNSDFPITLKVPGTSISKILLPGEGKSIYSNLYFDAILITLYDDEGVPFFFDFVPNGATLEAVDLLQKVRSIEGDKHSKVEAHLK